MPNLLMIAPGAAATTTVTGFTTAAMPPFAVNTRVLSSGVTVMGSPGLVQNGDQFELSLSVAAKAGHGTTVPVEITSSSSDYHTTSVLNVQVQ
jgi:hypothetical protein